MYPGPHTYPQQQQQQQQHAMQQQPQQQAMQQMPTQYATNHQQAQPQQVGGMAASGAGQQPTAAMPKPVAPPLPTAVAPMRTAELAPAVKRKKRKIETPKTAFEKVKRVVPESAVFSQLCEVEAEVDALLQRKRADMVSALHAPEMLHKKLRVLAFTEQQEREDGDGVPGWTVTLWGRLIDPAEADGPPTPASSAPGGDAPTEPALQPARRVERVYPFMWYCDSLVIEVLDKSGAPTGDRGEWRRDKHSGEWKDKFQFSRAGSEDVDLRVTLVPHTGLQLYNLSPWLSAFMGVNKAPRGKVLQCIWQYIKQHKLINMGNPTLVDLDERLSALLKCGRQVPLGSIGARLDPLMAPMPPYSVEYTARVSGAEPGQPAGQELWDFDVWLPAGPADVAPPFLQRVGRDKELEAVDAKLAAVLRRLNEARRKRTFLLGFSQSPVAFIRALVSSNARDLRQARVGGVQAFEAVHRCEFFKGRWVEDAVLRYLHRKLASVPS